MCPIFGREIIVAKPNSIGGIPREKPSPCFKMSRNRGAVYFYKIPRYHQKIGGVSGGPTNLTLIYNVKWTRNRGGFLGVPLM